MSRPPGRHLGRSWTAGLVLALSGTAQAGEEVCGGGQCGATAIAPALLRKAVTGALQEAPVTPQPARKLAQPAATAWNSRFTPVAGQEAYDCALSFGIGASLGDNFLATRLLGRTRVWRERAKGQMSSD